MTTSPARVVADRYELLTPLGHGGVGTVWRAHDRRLQRDVAIKAVTFGSFRDSAEVETARARFVREARAAARLSHPAVIGIYDVVISDDVAHLVMELVEAPTLGELVRAEGPRTPAVAASIGLDLLAALEVAHAEGIVHRDVKPGNVMVTAEGSAKLADFGIAAVTGDADLTATGLVIGSPAYMSPEQAQGHRTTPATDLWSLGATLYFAVEGVAPFAREGSIPTLTAIVGEPPRPPEVTGPLADVLHGLLQKEPQDRLSVTAARRGLEQVASGAVATPVPRAQEETVEVTPLAPAAGTPVPPAGPDEHRPQAGPARTAGPGLVAVLLFAAVTLALVAVAMATGVFEVGTDPAADQAAVDAPDEEAPPEGDVPTDGEQGADETEPDETEPGEAEGSDEADEAAEAEDSDEADEAADEGEPDDPAVDAPEDWEPFTIGAAGATVARPASWTPVERTDFRFDLVAPEDPTYLRVEYTDTPGDDAVADWQRQSEAFGANRSGYEELRIDPVDIDGAETAALWEYRWEEDGVVRRAVNLAIVTQGRGYALNLVSTEDRWDEVAPLFEDMVASFEPGPPPG